jgi:hypothetical protein
MLAGASGEAKGCNKAAFLHVLSTLVGSEVKVQTADARSISGVFYTATPHVPNNFLVAIKVSRVEVRERRHNGPGCQICPNSQFPLVPHTQLLT